MNVVERKSSILPILQSKTLVMWFVRSLYPKHIMIYLISCTTDRYSIYIMKWMVGTFSLRKKYRIAIKLECHSFLHIIEDKIINS